MFKHKLTLKPNRGVTLIELILVLAISAFMIVLALGGLTNRGRVQFDDGVSQVLNNLRQVQNEAVNGQAPICTVGASNCLQSGHQVFGRGVSFRTTSNEYKTFLVNSWGPDNAALQQGVVPEQTRKFPAGVRLTKIEQTNRHPDVLEEQPTLTLGLLIFARGNTVSATNGQVRNVGYPHFFNQDRVDRPFGGRYLNSEGSGFVAAARAVTYVSPRDNVVILTFQSPDNSSIQAEIVIDGKTGNMEIKK